MNNYRRLRGIILLVLFLFFAAFAAGRAQILVEDYRRTFDQAGFIAQNWASLLQQYTTRTFDTGDLLADVFMDEARQHGGLTGMRGESGRGLLAQLEGRAPGDFILVVDRRGVPVALSNRQELPTLPFADRQWFRAHAQSGIEAYIGPSIISRVSQDILFTFSRRLTLANGEFDGVFLMAMRSSFFEGIQLSATIGREARFALWRTSGELIGRTGMTAEEVTRGISDPVLARYAAQARSGIIRRESQVDVSDRIVAYTVVPKWDLIVTASLPVEVALEPWRARLFDSLVFVLLIAALGVLAGWWTVLMARRLERSTHHLEMLVRRKENLLREMHHRVKNNLQIVTSLMRMGARRSRSKPVQLMVADLDERIHAMSLVFEMVYRSDLSGEVSMRDYVTRLVETISKSYSTEDQGVDVSVASEDFKLNSDRLGVMGLLVTELVTNALKHAFRDHDRPRIDVRVRREGESVVLHVADNGRGFDAEASSRSLGMVMIRAFVQQLEGEIEFSNEGGTHVTVRFPLRATVVPDSTFQQAAA